jgi:hypothetical protein
VARARSCGDQDRSCTGTVALVVPQDYALSVAEAREVDCTISDSEESHAFQIEQEGLDGNWPPL